MRRGSRSRRPRGAPTSPLTIHPFSGHHGGPVPYSPVRLIDPGRPILLRAVATGEAVGPRPAPPLPSAVREDPSVRRAVVLEVDSVDCQWARTVGVCGLLAAGHRFQRRIRGYARVLVSVLTDVTGGGWPPLGAAMRKCWRFSSTLFPRTPPWGIRLWQTDGRLRRPRDLVRGGAGARPGVNSPRHLTKFSPPRRPRGRPGGAAR